MKPHTHQPILLDRLIHIAQRQRDATGTVSGIEADDAQRGPFRDPQVIVGSPGNLPGIPEAAGDDATRERLGPGMVLRARVLGEDADRAGGDQRQRRGRSRLHAASALAPAGSIEPPHNGGDSTSLVSAWRTNIDGVRGFNEAPERRRASNRRSAPPRHREESGCDR